MKALLSLVLATGLAFGVTFQTSDNLTNFKVQDQFEKDLVVTKDTKKLIVAFSKEKGEEIKKHLEANPNYLQEQNAIYLADVSAAPSFVTSLFMIPKFKKYPYSMGLIKDEEFATKFPKQEEMITIISIENFVITQIDFVKNL